MKGRSADRAATMAFWAAAGFVILLLAFLLGRTLYYGLPHISWDFLTGPPSNFKAGGGVGPQLFNSLYLLVISMLITVPLAVTGAIYLAEYAKEGPLASAIRLSLETLASLPSIVVGLFGLLLFVNLAGWGYSALAGAMALTVLNLPAMVRIAEEALRAVPRELREASLALGVPKWVTIRKVVLPAAFPALLTGVVLISGRVFGEAAALLYTAGMSSPNISLAQLDPTSPRSAINLFRPAETLAVHIWKVNSEGVIPDIRRVADGSAAVLVLVVMVFNLLARWLGRRVGNRLMGTGA